MYFKEQKRACDLIRNVSEQLPKNPSSVEDVTCLL